MRPISLLRSKSMLPFLGQPLLSYLLAQLRAASLTDVVVTDRGLNGDIQRHFQEGEDYGMSLSYAPPAKWHGTAGTVLSLIRVYESLTDHTVVVIYGDSLLRMDFSALIDFHRAKRSKFTIAYHRPRLDRFLFEGDPNDQPRTNFGVMQLRSDDRVTRFEEKPHLHRIPLEFTNPVASAAVYVLEPTVFREVPRFDTLDFGFDLIPWLIERSMPVYGFDILPGHRIDIGTLSHYCTAQLAVLEGKINLARDAAFGTAGVQIHHGAVVHPTARLVPPVFVAEGVEIEESAMVENSIIGEGTHIGPLSQVRNSVVLEGVLVGARAIVDGSILAEHCVVSPDANVSPGTAVGAWSRIGGGTFILPEDAQHGLFYEGEYR